MRLASRKMRKVGRLEVLQQELDMRLLLPVCAAFCFTEKNPRLPPLLV